MLSIGWKMSRPSIGEKFGHNYYERLWFMIYVFDAFVVRWEPYKHVIQIMYPLSSNLFITLRVLLSLCSVSGEKYPGSDV